MDRSLPSLLPGVPCVDSPMSVGTNPGFGRTYAAVSVRMPTNEDGTEVTGAPVLVSYHDFDPEWSATRSGRRESIGIKSETDRIKQWRFVAQRWREPKAHVTAGGECRSHSSPCGRSAGGGKSDDPVSHPNNGATHAAWGRGASLTVARPLAAGRSPQSPRSPPASPDRPARRRVRRSRLDPAARNGGFALRRRPARPRRRHCDK